MPKSLTVQQEIAIYKYLMEHCRSSGQIVGLLLMFALGLRNEEACGVNFGHIFEMTEYPGNYCLIIAQTTTIGRNTLKLGGKTSNANRCIPLPNSVAALLDSIKQQRISLIKSSKEHADICADTLPIACFNNNYTKRCDAQHLTDAANAMFRATGIARNILIDIAQDLQEQHTIARESANYDEFDRLEREPTAYLLRRNFATHLLLLGLDEEEIQYIMGHAIETPGIARRDFSDESLLMGIKKKLDKRPLLNKIIEATDIELLTNNAVDFADTYHVRLRVPAGTTRIMINVSASVPGDKIIMQINSNTPEFQANLTCFNYPKQPHAGQTEPTGILQTYIDAYRNDLENNAYGQ